MSDPELTPAQERAVRDRLADARHTGPAPDAVVARLDETLGRLAAERTELPVTAPVVTLASRRRRTAAAVLVAAAAVVVAGVGIGQVLPTGGEDAATSGAGGAADRELGARAPQAEQDSGAPGPADARRSAGAQADAPGAATGLPTAALSSDDLRRDLRVLADLAATGYDRSVTCDAGDVGEGRLLPVTYDGQEALVVLRTPRAGFRQADVYLCGDDSPVRSLELPAR